MKAERYDHLILSLKTTMLQASETSGLLRNSDVQEQNDQMAAGRVC